MNDVQIKHMVNRFLMWRLPEPFRPDAGISFTPPPRPEWWPIGTNLFDANQAEAMVRHMVDGLDDIPLTAEEAAMLDEAWEKHKAAEPLDNPIARAIRRGRGLLSRNRGRGDD